MNTMELMNRNVIWGREKTRGVLRSIGIELFVGLFLLCLAAETGNASEEATTEDLLLPIQFNDDGSKSEYFNRILCCTNELLCST